MDRVHVPVGGADAYITATGGATSLTELTDVTGEPAPGFSPVADESSQLFPLTRVTTQDDLEAILTAVAEVDWHVLGAAGEPAFQAGFRPTGEPWCPPRYRLTLNNVVHLEGQASNDDGSSWGSTWLPLFQFPPEATPGASLRFACLANDRYLGKVIVWEDGLVLWGGQVTGPTDVTPDVIEYVSLDGISFSVGGNAVLASALAARA